MKIEVSNGEIADKYTILKIKLKHSQIGTEKYFNINSEYAALKTSITDLNIPDNYIEELYDVNQKLWNIEDSIRLLESKKQFDESFIELARSVYMTNDKRFLIKKKINELSNSAFKEEKILPNYNMEII
jgi:hypothetical protein